MPVCSERLTSVAGRGETGGDEEEQAADKNDQIHPGGGVRE